MKKIFIGIAAIVAISLGSACKKFLDQAPLDKVSLDQFYKSRMDIDAGIAGMYSAFQQMMIGKVSLETGIPTGVKPDQTIIWAQGTPVIQKLKMR